MGGRGNWGKVGPRGAAVSKPLVGQDPQTSDLHTGGRASRRARVGSSNLLISALRRWRKRMTVDLSKANGAVGESIPVLLALSMGLWGSDSAQVCFVEQPVILPHGTIV